MMIAQREPDCRANAPVHESHSNKRLGVSPATADVSRAFPRHSCSEEADALTDVLRVAKRHLKSQSSSFNSRCFGSDGSLESPPPHQGLGSRNAMEHPTPGVASSSSSASAANAHGSQLDHGGLLRTVQQLSISAEAPADEVHHGTVGPAVPGNEGAAALSFSRAIELDRRRHASEHGPPPDVFRLGDPVDVQEEGGSEAWAPGTVRKKIHTPEQ